MRIRILSVFSVFGVLACLFLSASCLGPDMSKVELNAAPTCQLDVLIDAKARKIMDGDFSVSLAEGTCPKHDPGGACRCKACVEETYESCLTDRPDCGMRGCRAIAREACSLGQRCN